MKKLVSILTILLIISCNGYTFFNNTVYAEDGESETVVEPTPEVKPETTSEPTPEPVTTEETKENTDLVAEPTAVPTTAPVKTNSSNSSNKSTTTSTKSTNANLANLGINPNDFTGFKSGTTTYNVEVENNVTEVTVYAKAQDSKAKISGTGKKTLEEGKNALNVVVTAENGTTKTYTINVTRKASDENKEEKPKEETTEQKEEIKEVKGLSELKIAGIEMTPKFNPEVFSYTVNYVGNDTKLNITTKTGDASATVEITGNEDLVEGDNLINILVTDKDGKVYTYQVTVKKSLSNQNEANGQLNIKNIIIIAVIVILVLGIIIFVVKKIRNRNDIKEDNDDYDEEMEKIESFEKNNKKAYVNSILQTSVDEEDEKEVVQQDSWFKKEIEKEKNEEYGGPIIYEPDNTSSELKIEKPVKKKGRAKGKRFK